MLKNSDSEGIAILQWMTEEFIKRKKKEEGDFVTGVDEFSIEVVNGKIGAITSESKVKLSKQGVFNRLFNGKDKKELILVDTSKHTLTIPYEAYTKDRDLIRGTIDLFMSIDKNNITSSLRLLKERNPYGMINDEEGFREIWLQDVIELLRRNIEYIINTEAFINYNAEEVQYKRDSICTDIISTLNSKSPYWASYGMIVTYSSVTIDENRYEELERKNRETALNAMERDAVFGEDSSQSEDRIRKAQLVAQEKASMELNIHLVNLNTEAALRRKEEESVKQQELDAISDEAEIETARMEAEFNSVKMKIYHQREIKRLESDTEMDEIDRELRIKEIRTRIAQIDRDERMKDVQADIAVNKAKDDYSDTRRESDLDYDLKRKKSEYDLEKQREDDRLRRELEKRKAEADLMRQMSEHDDKMAEIKESNRHGETMAKTDAEVKISENQLAYNADVAKAEGKAAAAQAQYEGYKEAVDATSKRNMEQLRAMSDIMSKGSSAPVSEKKDVLICPGCREEIPAKAKFCPFCGVSFVKKDDKN